MRTPFLLLTGVLLVAACGGKTIDAGGGDGGPSASSSGSGSGSSSGSGSGSSGGGSGGGGSASSGSSSGGSAGSGSSSGGGPTSYCETTNTVSCSGGATGFLCSGGLNPVTADPSLECSVPTPVAGGEAYCCFGFTSSGGSSSSSGGPVPSSCTADASIDCAGGASGFSCASGGNPEAEEPSLTCSIPTTSSDGTDDYCCFYGFPSSPAGCMPDDYLTSTCPDFGSYGFQCGAGEDPSAFDAQLDCSSGIPDPDGLHDDYCCTY